MIATAPAFFEIIDREFRFDVPGVLEGWTTPEKGKHMAELILEHKPETLIDLGCFGGRSTIAMALAVRQNGIGKVHGIDPWKLTDAIEGEQDEANTQWWSNNVNLHEIHRGAMEAIWRLGLDDWIVVIRSASQHVPHLFTGGVDFIHLDGNHSETASCRDVRLYAPMLTPKAILVFDDCQWPSTQKAIRLLDEWCDMIQDVTSYRVYQRK